MFVRKKHIQVILFSSVIIAVAFVSALVGYNLYTQWKKDSFALKYRNSVYKLTAELFREDIFISNVCVKAGDNDLFRGLPLVVGSLKNNSGKTVTSVLVEVSFVEPRGAIIYKDWFHPLGEQHFGSLTLLPEMKRTRNVLLPGEGISFSQGLRNCPREVIEQLSGETGSAGPDAENRIKMVCSITGLSVL